MKPDEKHSALSDASGSAQDTHDPRLAQAKEKQRNRLARGAAPAGRSKTSVKRSNGHPRVNGHDRASSPNSALPAPDGRGSAASVDANGASAAGAAISAAAGTDRHAYAEVAQASNGRAQPGHAGAGLQAEGKEPRVSGDAREIPPGENPLPGHPSDFVEEIHKKIDLTEVWHDLLRSADDKIKQRAVERLTDLRYKGAATSADEPQRIVIDMPRPDRD